jgi:hypothetical protein
MTARLRAFGATAGCAALLAMTVVAAAQKSVKAGVYTEAQADRGQTLFRSKCASWPCAFASPTTLSHEPGWRPLWEMFDVIGDSMPEDDPQPEEGRYADVIARLKEQLSGRRDRADRRMRLVRSLMQCPEHNRAKRDRDRRCRRRTPPHQSRPTWRSSPASATAVPLNFASNATATST